MTRITEYNRYNAHNSQDDLDKLAKDIFASGKIVSINHFTYQTTNPAQGGSYEEMVAVKNGGACYEVEREGFPVKYYVHMHGLTVTNITERIDY